MPNAHNTTPRHAASPASLPGKEVPGQVLSFETRPGSSAKPRAILRASHASTSMLQNCACRLLNHIQDIPCTHCRWEATSNGDSHGISTPGADISGMNLHLVLPLPSRESPEIPHLGRRQTRELADARLSGRWLHVAHALFGGTARSTCPRLTERGSESPKLPRDPLHHTVTPRLPSRRSCPAEPPLNPVYAIQGRLLWMRQVRQPSRCRSVTDPVLSKGCRI